MIKSHTHLFRPWSGFYRLHDGVWEGGCLLKKRSCCALNDLSAMPLLCLSLCVFLFPCTAAPPIPSNVHVHTLAPRQKTARRQTGREDTHADWVLCSWVVSRVAYPFYCCTSLNKPEEPIGCYTAWPFEEVQVWLFSCPESLPAFLFSSYLPLFLCLFILSERIGVCERLVFILM